MCGTLQEKPTEHKKMSHEAPEQPGAVNAGPEQINQAAPVQQDRIFSERKIREKLVKNEDWSIKFYWTKEEEQKSPGTLLAEHGERTIRWRSKNRAFIRQVYRKIPLAKAGEAAEGTPVQELVPAEKTDKKLEEEAKQTKAARKKNSVADYASFNLNKQVTTYYKERNNALKGKWRTMVGNATMGDAVFGFLRGHAAGLFAKNADRDNADLEFVTDYVSENLERRRPHLERCVEEVLAFSIRRDMFTSEYLAVHGQEMVAMREKMASMAAMMNDPVNVPFFRQLPQERRELLEFRIQRERGVFSNMLTHFMAGKGLREDGEYYEADQAEEVAQEAAEAMVNDDIEFGRVQNERRALLRGHNQRHFDAHWEQLREQVRAEMNLKADEWRERSKAEWDRNKAKCADTRYFSTSFTAPYISQFTFRTNTIQKLVAAFPARYKAYRNQINRLYAKLFRTLDSAADYLAKVEILRRIADEKQREAGSDREGDVALAAQIAREEAEVMAEEQKQLELQVELYESLISFFLQPRQLTEEESNLAFEEEVLEEARELADEWEASYEEQFGEQEQKQMEERHKDPEQFREMVEQKVRGLTFVGLTQQTYDGKVSFVQYAASAIERAEKNKRHFHEPSDRLQTPSFRAIQVIGPKGNTIMDGSITRLCAYLEKCDPNTYSLQELQDILDKLTICGRAKVLKRKQENKPDSLTREEQEQLEQYTPEYIEEQFNEGLRALKKIMLERCRQVVRRYGHYLLQLHPADLLARAPDVMEDVSEGFAYTQITDHIDTLDISNSEEDRELLILLGYLHAVHQRLGAYFGNHGADVKEAAAAGQSRFKPKGEAGKEGEAVKGLAVLASVGTEYLRRYFPGIPGLTEIEKLDYDQDPKEYLKLMVE